MSYIFDRVKGLNLLSVVISSVQYSFDRSIIWVKLYNSDFTLNPFLSELPIQIVNSDFGFKPQHKIFNSFYSSFFGIVYNFIY